jgi:hypothetical protein
VQGSESVLSQSAARVSPGSAERRELFVQELLYFSDFDDPVIVEYRTILRNLNGIREIARFNQKQKGLIHGCFTSVMVDFVALYFITNESRKTGYEGSLNYAWGSKHPGKGYGSRQSGLSGPRDIVGVELLCTLRRTSMGEGREKRVCLRINYSFILLFYSLPKQSAVQLI